MFFSRKCPREPLIFLSALCFNAPPPFSHPFSCSLTPIALARNTAPCFSWQNSAGCPCVPEKPAFSPSSRAARAHISHIFCLLSFTLASPQHPGSQAWWCRAGGVEEKVTPVCVRSTSSVVALPRVLCHSQAAVAVGLETAHIGVMKIT